ncbi:MAG: DUF4012 domain-containing protein [Actinomycetota bacterium]|nr:DUF4012 domain-containing protein [Actinomycetota bacterium]
MSQGFAIRRFSISSQQVVIVVIIAAAAVAGAVSGCHPLAVPIYDPVYDAVWSALVVALAVRAGRGSLIWLAVVATALSHGWVLIPAALALVLAVAHAFRDEACPPLNALVAALGLGASMHWTFHVFQGASALAAVGGAVPVLVSGLVGLSPRVRRLVLLAGVGAVMAVCILVIPLGVAALTTRGRIDQGIGDAQDALHKLTGGNVSAGRQELTAAAEDFRTSRDSLGAWWTAGARLVPVVSEQRAALVDGVAVARAVTQAARVESSQVDVASLRYSGGGVDLAKVKSLAGPLNNIEVVLARADSVLRRAGNDWDIGAISHRLDTLRSDISRARSSIALGQQVVQDSPSLLGADGVRHYFVAFMDPPESRGLGGIIAWYGILTADQGRLTLTSEGDPLNFEAQLAQRGGGHLSGPSSYLNRYGQFRPQDHPVDLTYSPDLPTVTDVVSQIYSELGHPPIDGMLVLDPKSVSAVLAYAGPVYVSGFGELTPENTAELLDKGQYALYPRPDQQGARKEVLDAALKAASEQLTHGSVNVRALASDLSPLVHSGDLLFWSTHAGDQALLRRIGLAGSFPPAAGGDLLSFISQNAANNKVDAYLQRTLDYHVTFDPADGFVSSTLDVSLHNAAPSSGLPDEVIGSYPGSGLPLGSDLLWYSIYTPLQLSGATLDGRPITLREEGEFGLRTYSGYVSIRSGVTEKLHVELAGRVTRGSYRLQLHSQPTVLPDRILVTVKGSPGWRTDAIGTWQPPLQSNPTHIFRFSR